MDVTRILEQDHRDAEDLFAKIEAASGKRRQSYVDELSQALQAHMALEEDVVYPRMKPITGGKDVQEGITEHELARKILADVEALSPDEPGFGAALESLKAGISHHVDEEEHDVFPDLRAHGAKTLDDMSTPFMKKRVELGMPTSAAALEASSNKDELVSEATAAGVDGAKSMTKAELASALSANLS
jgi:iron-sulfur cluster repair protein YtfE (RIC family)